MDFANVPFVYLLNPAIFGRAALECTNTPSPCLQSSSSLPWIFAIVFALGLALGWRGAVAWRGRGLRIGLWWMAAAIGLLIATPALFWLGVTIQPDVVKGIDESLVAKAAISLALACFGWAALAFFSGVGAALGAGTRRLVAPRPA